MPQMVPFTNNYLDRSTSDGYQFEFYCQRCRSSVVSSFHRSLSGIASLGGRLLSIGGDLIGGEAGYTAHRVGWETDAMRGGGNARDKHLQKAVEEVAPQFGHCNRCGNWVCQQACWNAQRGVCADCSSRLGPEAASMPAPAQMNQMNQQIHGPAMCSSCGQSSGGGRFCQHCGAPLAAAAAAPTRFCGNCGTPQEGASAFCPRCGTPAG